jgi:hypothetical protein
MSSSIRRRAPCCSASSLYHGYRCIELSPVDNKNRPLRVSFSPLNAIFTSNPVKGTKITQERKGDATKALCPSLEARNVINTDTQNLGIQSLELAKFGFVRWDLVCSDRCPGQGENASTTEVLPRKELKVTSLSRWLGSVKSGAFCPTASFMITLLIISMVQRPALFANYTK